MGTRMSQGPLQIRTWIVMIRASISIVYESTSQEITPIHVFERLDLDLMSRWLDEARAEDRYDFLKLIAEPARVRELMRRLPAATCACVIDVRTEDLSRPDDEETCSPICLRHALRRTLAFPD